jgi:hypothetical protein
VLTASGVEHLDFSEFSEHPVQKIKSTHVIGDFRYEVQSHLLRSIHSTCCNTFHLGFSFCSDSTFLIV